MRDGGRGCGESTPALRDESRGQSGPDCGVRSARDALKHGEGGRGGRTAAEMALSAGRDAFLTPQPRIAQRYTVEGFHVGYRSFIVDKVYAFNPSGSCRKSPRFRSRGQRQRERPRRAQRTDQPCAHRSPLRCPLPCARRARRHRARRSFISARIPIGSQRSRRTGQRTHNSKSKRSSALGSGLTSALCARCLTVPSQALDASALCRRAAALL